MLFLAGAAFCSTDSYDPDPYDDIPPVVTVEFSYVVPGQISHAIIRTVFENGGLHALGYVERHRVPVIASLDYNSREHPPLALSETPESFVPLRR